MNALNFTKRIPAVMVVLCLLFLFGLPEKTQAQWHPKNKNIPGGSSSSTWILVGVGVVSTILLIKLATKNKGNKPDATKSIENKNDGEKQDSLKANFVNFDALIKARNTRLQKNEFLTPDVLTDKKPLASLPFENNGTMEPIFQNYCITLQARIKW